MYLDPASREMSDASHIRSSMMVCVSQGRVCLCVTEHRADPVIVGIQSSRWIGSARLHTPPRWCTYPYGGGAVGIIHRLAAETILVPPSAHEALRCERNVQSCFHVLLLAHSRVMFAASMPDRSILERLLACSRRQRTRQRSV
jgi:hypothetical protein